MAAAPAPTEAGLGSARNLMGTLENLQIPSFCSIFFPAHSFKTPFGQEGSHMSVFVWDAIKFLLCPLGSNPPDMCESEGKVPKGLGGEAL